MYDGPGGVGGDWSNPHTVSSVGNTLLYASMVLDPVTGLYNDEARWYSTAVSTFISRDPAQADLNTYRYCGNMPTQAIDPSGEVILSHCPIDKYLDGVLDQGSYEREKIPLRTAEGESTEVYIYRSKLTGSGGSLFDQVLIRMMRSLYGYAVAGSSEEECLASIREQVMARYRIVKNTWGVQVKFGEPAPVISQEFDPYDPPWVWMALNNTETTLDCAAASLGVFYGGAGTAAGQRSFISYEDLVPGENGT